MPTVPPLTLTSPRMMPGIETPFPSATPAHTSMSRLKYCVPSYSGQVFQRTNTYLFAVSGPPGRFSFAPAGTLSGVEYTWADMPAPGSLRHSLVSMTAVSSWVLMVSFTPLRVVTSTVAFRGSLGRISTIFETKIPVIVHSKLISAAASIAASLTMAYCPFSASSQCHREFSLGASGTEKVIPPHPADITAPSA